MKSSTPIRRDEQFMEPVSKTPIRRDMQFMEPVSKTPIILGRDEQI